MANNPSNISQPNLSNPTLKGGGSKERKSKGNKPYLDFRKRIRKDIFR